MPKLFFLFFSYLFPFGLQSQISETTNSDQLIVFIQGINSEVELEFKEKTLPGIENLAKEVNLDFIIYNITDSAPKEIKYTPAIVFHNKKEHFIYRGKWNKIEHIEHFIKNRQKNIIDKKENTNKNNLLWAWGRTRISIKTEINSLQGKVPKKFNHKHFLEQAQMGIEKGTPRAHFKNHNSGDQQFKMVFHSSRDRKGRYSITGEILLENDSKNPIYRHLKNPIIDENPKIAFKKMAAILEEQILYFTKSPSDGNGFDIIPQYIKSIPWNIIGK